MKKLFSKLLPIILVISLIFQPVYGATVVFAVDEVITPTPAAENNQTGDNSTNNAQSTDTQTTDINNLDNTTIDNNISSDANSGNNTIGEVTPTPENNLEQILTPTPTDETNLTNEPTPEVTPTPIDQLLPTPEFSLTPTPSETLNDLSVTPTPTIDETLGLQSDLTLIPESTTSGGICAINENTGEGSTNTSNANQTETTLVINNNTSEIANEINLDSNTGDNSVQGEEGQINTGDSTATANLANVANTNLTGEDFWQTIINIFSTTQNDIDLTNLPEINSLDPALLSILSQNTNTGDGSINLALANFLSNYAVYNQNNGTLTNNINLAANTGNNQIVGEDGTIQTGDASTYLNLFNMMNTNLTGQDWFFGIINLFGGLEGDIILPYELDYLGSDAICSNGITTTNNNTGEGSTNNASTNLVNSTLINNTNNGDLTNNISSSANSGNNQITGEDNNSIQTGNASSLVNLLNMVNTNITGSNWLLLTINNVNKWSGSLSGWWGNFFTIGNTGYAWIKLPDSATSNSVSSLNQNTGDGSTNNSSSNQSNNLLVNNNSQAQLTNNINANANTGGNLITGEDNNSIQTGNADSKVNVVNMVNTNITGNHWFFGVINLFDNFLGNIIFPRPDLALNIGANNSKVIPNQELTYTISYKNIGNVWSRNTNLVNNLPANVSFLSCSNSCSNNGNSLSWNLGKLDKGGEGSVTFIVRTNPDIANGSQLVDSAIVSTDMDEPNKTNNVGGVTILASWSTQSDQNNNNDGSNNNNSNNSGSSNNDSSSNNSSSSTNSEGSGESQSPSLLADNSFLSGYSGTSSLADEIVKTTNVINKPEVLGSQTSPTTKNLLNKIIEKSWLGLILVILVGMIVRIKKYLALRA